MKKIVVVGSISTDFVAQTSRFPEVGETVEGQAFSTHFGGKGANQAVAAAKLFPHVQMIGAVGDDPFAKNLIANLENHQIDARQVIEVSQQGSGAALIVLAKGDNQIVYTPGANNAVTADLVDQAKEDILSASLVLVQNEIPKESVHYLLDLCQDKQVPVLLNPAPARDLSEDDIDKIAYLTPNENEFDHIFKGQDQAKVLAKYPNKLIITLGSNGVKFHNGQEVIHVPSIEPYQVKDTTGAGDTFNGALAVAMVHDLPLDQAIHFANLAASLSIEKIGAQTGSPNVAEVKARGGIEIDWLAG